MPTPTPGYANAGMAAIHVAAFDDGAGNPKVVTPSSPYPVAMGSGVVTTLLNAVTATGAGASSRPLVKNRTFHISGNTSSGVGSAAVKVEGSNDNATWVTLATINLTLSATPTADGFASDAPWAYVRGNVSAISGTGAAITLMMGV